ncbi:AAA family ATPase [Brevibacillus invocatus]|uniref:AAA family ATPase n=1 Tax=Brevibacillus invocatus TaxID=173959 RepID=UPI0020421F56|nr:AAA family ATPase [Brevibacillus invocatus]MCM3432592.1 AAA family ATPase [Brevibacillus invocatus]
MDRIIYFYERNQYQAYKLQKIAEGKTISTITEFLNDNEVDWLNAQDFYIVDLSSLCPFMKERESLVFQFEQLLSKFGNHIEFIVEEKYKDDLFYYLKYVFDDIQPITLEKKDEQSLAEEPSGENEQILPPVRKITNLTEEELNSFYTEFNDKLYGHTEFKKELRLLIDTFRIFNKIGEHKILSLFLMGDSGVGKTEVARTIQKCLKSKKKLAKISFGNYSSKDALNSLIGSPLGYIGSDGGELMTRVNESDIGLILIDEFEKGDSAVFNYFLDVLENGKLTNTRAEEYDVDGYIIVFTSNITKEQFLSHITPELRSRFDYKGVFDFLTDNDKKKFVNHRINEIVDKYNALSGHTFDIKLRAKLIKSIDYSSFRNMRDLNKVIKNTFVQCIQGKLK